MIPKLLNNMCILDDKDIMLGNNSLNKASHSDGIQIFTCLSLCDKNPKVVIEIFFNDYTFLAACFDRSSYVCFCWYLEETDYLEHWYWSLQKSLQAGCDCIIDMCANNLD